MAECGNKRLLVIAAIQVLVAIFALGGDGGAVAARGRPEAASPQYLALGDSLAVGIGSSDPATKGYVPLFYDYLREALDPGAANPAPLASVPDAFNRRFLQLEDLGVGGPGAPAGGETTSTMISGGQLAAAVADLTARNGNATPVDDVRVVTLSIGGNDIFTAVPACSSGLTPGCATAISSALATFTANFDFILGELRAAAGPDTPIVVMTYFNTLVNPGCPLNSLAALGDIIAEGDASLGLPLGLNDIIRLTAASHDANVADVFGLLGPSDLQPDCRHPNDAGYEIIADQFIAAFGG